ncbi:cell cycle checkpoint control protein RAD9A [Hyalella azteca]|uniref:Cell cycle checkpoint control protein RAD9A n=1 Tax=Hyalella azteca TaxID=294128 RepID=A0A8B7P986_HYAAZ|nr:cell cycle checkpoint control protein RAD9A [Hyalella azteca]
MKCAITGVNIKVFARSIHSLARIGDELHVEPRVDGVSFCTVNSSRSAFASFLYGESFFSQYESGVDAPSGSCSQSSSLQSDAQAVKCKVAMKAFLGAFKSLSNVEKSVERCKIMVDEACSKLLVQLVCRYSVVRNYHLPFIECETLAAVYDESSCPYTVTSPSRLLSDVLVNFQPGQDEVSFKVTPTSASMRNYVDDEPDLTKVIRTELQLENDEFDSFNIASDGEVVFNLKELRAILSFSEPCNLPVKACFSQPGSPVIFGVENKPLFECKFVLATLIPTSVAESQAGTANGASLNTTINNASTALKEKKTRADGKHHVVEHHQPEMPHELDAFDPCVPDNSNLGLNSCHQPPRKEPGSESDDIPLMARSIRALENVKSTEGYNRHSTAERQPANGSTPSCQAQSPARNSLLRRHVEESDMAVLCDGVSVDRTRSPLRDVAEEIRDLGAIDDQLVMPNDVPPEAHSPPLKKKRKHFLFYRCFNSTYNPAEATLRSDVLAPDSDPED